MFMIYILVIFWAFLMQSGPEAIRFGSGCRPTGRLAQKIACAACNYGHVCK